MQALKKLALKVLPEFCLTPLRKIHYARVLARVSDDFESEFKVVKAIIRPGETAIDLGAHVGIYSKYLSGLVGAQGKVFSVEPFPLTFDILRSNVSKLGLTNVTLLNCAVSNVTGKLTMEVPRFTQLGESFYDARIISPGSNSNFRHAEVDVKTVDDLFKDARDVSFVKCDVEGQELNTLQSSTALIHNHHPAWLLEISLMDSETHSEIRRLLQDHGYEEFWYDKTLKPWKPGDKPVDVFFLQPVHLDRARKSGLY
jgi:FkbM family methyltransferase